MVNSKTQIISEIKKFLDGSNQEYKYLVNVETDGSTNLATCIFDSPEEGKYMQEIPYTPFIYTKDFKKHNINFYDGREDLIEAKMKSYGIIKTRLKSGKQPRLEDGFCYKYTSTKSYHALLNFFKDGQIPVYQKKYKNGKVVKDHRDRPVYLYKHLFYSLNTTEQFFISTGIRLFKGVEEYKDVHRLTFDIETTGLRYEISRVFAIGIRDNRGFEYILEVSKQDDDDAERNLIQDFFNIIAYINPSVIQGYNSEDFDFEFMLGRAEILKIDLEKLKTTLSDDVKIKRIRNSSVKIGNTTEKYTATKMWGFSILDINHAAKKTAAINTDVKNTKLKYICKFEEIAKPNRMYIDGSDGNIGKYWHDNMYFIINPDNNEYLELPSEFQKQAEKLYILQNKKDEFSEEEYKNYRNIILKKNINIVSWLKDNGKKYGNYQFISGKKILEQYLLDDLWETEQVDELYNQSTFLLAKLLPTTYQRVATMGNASVWNLLMTTWSYENDLAIPDSDIQENFGGGLTRCYKKGYTKRIVKIDFASLYPMIQLTWDVFPMFDITGVIKKMLVYMTTTRNIYKKLANSDDLREDEIELLKEIDHDTYEKFINNKILDSERSMFKVKQLPIKIINNSLFGALGSGVAFNWSDNFCAARITSTGRLLLREVIAYYKKFGLEPLLAVTDGVNFGIPDKTTIKVEDGIITYDQPEDLIENMWKMGNKIGVNAIIELYNHDVLKKNPESLIALDNDGEFISCYNLSRINYALLQEKKDKKTGKIKTKVKLTGNTIKSKTMPEYIEDFVNKGFDMILNGQGYEFVEYYYEYAEKIFYKRIPLKKIASKNKVKVTINQYLKRGTDKNGREKGKQAHMELLIMEREKIANELFEKHKHSLISPDHINDNYTIKQKMDIISDYMPPEPELDSMVYYINTGNRKSHGNSDWITDDNDNTKKRYTSKLINQKDMEENPDLLGEYNVDKYFDAFNKRVEVLIDGFEPEVRKKILAKIITKKDKNKKEIKTFQREYFTKEQLTLKNFDEDLFDESMFIEDKEVKFWNKYGLNPNLVWDGFKVPEDNPLLLDIYDFKLKHVEKLMLNIGKPKSINDKLNKNDYVLLKNNDIYSLGYYNGNYIQIVRNNIDLPKCDLEIEIEEKQKREAEMIKKQKEEAKKQKNKEMLDKMFSDVERVNNLYEKFKEIHNIPDKFTKEQFFEAVPDAKTRFENFVVNYNKADEYIGVDD
jgi:DNA polymerase elongation subunit (family B)